MNVGAINAEDVNLLKVLRMTQLTIFTYMGVGESLNQQSPMYLTM